MGTPGGTGTSGPQRAFATLARGPVAMVPPALGREEETHRAASLLAQVTPRAGERWWCQVPQQQRRRCQPPRGVPPPSGFRSLPFAPAADGLLHPGEGPLPYFSPRPLLPLPSLRSRCSRAKWHSFRVPLSADLEMWANGGSCANGFPPRCHCSSRQTCRLSPKQGAGLGTASRRQAWSDKEVLTRGPLSACEGKCSMRPPMSATRAGRRGDASPTLRHPASSLTPAPAR